MHFSLRTSSLYLLVAGITLVLAAGCATQHEATQGQAMPGAGQVQSLVIFVVSDSAAVRSEVEDTFSLSMSAAGVPTKPTYPHLPSLQQLEDDDAIIAMFKETGANMGLTVELLEAQSEGAQKAQGALFATWAAGVLLDDPVLRSAGAWGGLAAYNKAGKYKVRLNLWDAETAELQWTADTQSFTNEDVRQDAEKLAEFTRDELAAQGLLK
jgi:hypothetical protein